MEKYDKHFRDNGLKKTEFKDWLQPVMGNVTKAFCKYCKVILSGKKSDLNKYAFTTNHTL